MDWLITNYKGGFIMITVRKIKLTIIGTDEERKQGYKFIRDSQYAQ